MISHFLVQQIEAQRCKTPRPRPCSQAVLRLGFPVQRGTLYVARAHGRGLETGASAFTQDGARSFTLHSATPAPVLRKDSERREQSLGQGVEGKWDGFEYRKRRGGTKAESCPGDLSYSGHRTELWADAGLFMW